MALHLAQAWAVVSSLAEGRLPSPLGDISQLAAATTASVRAEPERDLRAMADRIETAATGFLRSTSGEGGDRPRPWLVEGSEVPLRSLACHLLNESLVHGYDMARADGREWRIDPADARLVLLGFILPVLHALPPRALVDQQTAAGLRACYDLRLRGGGQAYFVFDDGGVSVEAPSSRRVDCHLSADPVDLLLVVWARKSQWSAIVKAGLIAWGRKPWLGPRLRTLMTNP